MIRQRAGQGRRGWSIPGWRGCSSWGTACRSSLSRPLPHLRLKIRCKYTFSLLLRPLFKLTSRHRAPLKLGVGLVALGQGVDKLVGAHVHDVCSAEELELGVKIYLKHCIYYLLHIYHLFHKVKTITIYTGQ